MAVVTDPFYGVLTLQMDSATTFSPNPTCVPAMPCATPFLNLSGVPSQDYTVAVFEEKSTSLASCSTGTASSVHALVFRTIPFWQFSDHTESCYKTLTARLQLEAATGFDLTAGFNKGAYAVATSVELDASQGATVEWIRTMPPKMQSFFLSAYLPQFTEDFTVEVFAAPTESATIPGYPPTAPAVAIPSATEPLAASSKTLIAHRSEMSTHQESLLINLRSGDDNSTIFALVIAVSFLMLFGGGCIIVFCYTRSTRSRSSETSGSVGTERAEIDESHSIAAIMSQTSFRTEPVRFHGPFSVSEGSGSRHSYPSAQRFELGSSISSESSSDSDTDMIVRFNNLDNPFSDTAVISSLAREATPILSISPTQTELRHERMEDVN